MTPSGKRAQEEYLAKVIHNQEYGFGVIFPGGDEQRPLAAFHNDREAKFLADKLNRELAPIVSRASLASRLAEALEECRSALDTLMGDSDIEDDDSPEFRACQKASSALTAFSSLNEGDGGKH